MTNTYYRLPPDLAADIEAYEQEVRSFIASDLPPGVMKAKRVPRGVYEQRRNGSYMLRVRVAGGTLTCEQAEALAALAVEYGNGLLHVTTRQDVQLHDIAIGDTPGIMRRLMAVGLTSKGGGGNTVRNVTACPYAGVCPYECFDVTPLAHAVTEYLIPLVGSYNLPRKYKIAFSGCAADCALAQVSDLGFIAEMRDGAPGVRVLAGGGMGANSRVADELLDWVPVAKVTRIAESVRRLFDLLGNRNDKNRARLRYVFEKIGLEAFRGRFENMMREVEQEGVPEWRFECDLNDDKLECNGERPWLEIIEGVRCLPQRQKGFVAVPLHLPLGFVAAEDFAAIGAVARRFCEEKGPRTTRSQNLLLRYVRRENLRGLTSDLGKLGIDTLDPDPLERFTACAGASTCRLGLCLARDAACACAEELDVTSVPTEVLQDMEVYINGCPNACGQQPIGQIGFFGTAKRVGGRLVPCYRITLGGRCNADGARLGVDVGQAPAKALPALLGELARDYQTGRREQEPFVAYFDRVGVEHFGEITARHTHVPEYDEHPEYYRDFGVDEDFSLAGRGAGECGAGVFEVIQEDLSSAARAKAPFDMLLPAARALLITRGVDAREPESVFRAFEKHFLDAGLVAEEFRSLLTRARGFVEGWGQALDGHEGAVERLLERVKLLFSTLDASLVFHPPDSEGSQSVRLDSKYPPTDGAGRSEVDAGPTETLDLSNVACPMNFVKARLRLESMAVGEALAIILDDGEPIQNVPASFRNEGQSIESSTDIGNGHWQVIVRKIQ